MLEEEQRGQGGCSWLRARKWALIWCSEKWGSPTPALQRPLCFLLSLRPLLFVPECLYICLCITKRDIFLSSESSTLGTFRWKMKWVNGTCPFFMIHTLIYFFNEKNPSWQPTSKSPYIEKLQFQSPSLFCMEAPPQRKKSGNRIMKSYWVTAAMGNNTTQAILKWGLTMKIGCTVFIAYGLGLEVLRVGYQKRVSLWVSCFLKLRDDANKARFWAKKEEL